jgi:hypothetical protein
MRFFQAIAAPGPMTIDTATMPRPRARAAVWSNKKVLRITARATGRVVTAML